MRQNRVLVVLVTMLLLVLVFSSTSPASDLTISFENRDDCVVLINESFENGFPPENWTNTGWLDSLYGEPYHGDHWAYSWAFGDVLTTPQLEFGVNTTLTFWYRAESATHPMSSEVYVNDTLVWSDYNYFHDYYLMATVHLDSFSGLKTISFHGHLSGDFYGVLLDLITVTTSPIVYVNDDFNSSTPGWQSTHFDVIQDGIDAIAENGTVFVYNGTYYENILVNKSIYLVGENKTNTIIDGQGLDDVIQITADNVCVEQFTIDNDQPDTPAYYVYGIHVVSCNNSIRDNLFIDNEISVEFFHASNNTFTNNSIQSSLQYGMSLIDSDDNLIEDNTFSMNTGGICLSGSCNNTISDNVIVSNFAVGCLLYIQSDNNTVINNSISQHEYAGIEIRQCEQLQILNNEVFDNNDYGIICQEAYDIMFSNNHIHDNVNIGLYCLLTQYSEFFHNRILNNDQGLILKISNNNIIFENTIENNGDVGISIDDNALYNLFYHNNLIDNSPNVYDEHNNTWDNETISEGNYWSDYNGSDTDNDGIGDTAYVIDGSAAQDNYPLMYEHVWFQIDIIQDAFDRGFPIRHAIDGDWAGAQNFTPMVNTCTKVDLFLRKFGSPDFNLTVELRTDHPQGPILDSLMFPPADIPSDWTWLEIDFSNVTVVEETDYFIVCPPAPNGVTTSFGYEWGYAFGNQYDNGSFWFTRDGGSLWRDLPTMYEFVFRTYGYDSII